MNDFPVYLNEVLVRSRSLGFGFVVFGVPIVCIDLQLKNVFVLLDILNLIR
jgi:hypothetical protein